MPNEYPPCPKRLVGTVKGVVTHAKCNDESKGRYRQLVQANDCHRCLAGPEAGPAETDEADAEAIMPGSPTPATGPPEAPPPRTPGLVHRAISYAEAVARWTAAGKPERPAKEVERIFHQFCKTCRWFHRRRQVCRGCGCRVAANGYAIFNKIKMATERCPKNLW
jgi:hypothetical protein